MIGFAFLPFKDEILYSWVVRYHKYSANLRKSQSLIDLFGEGYLNLKLHYPNNLGFLASAMSLVDEFAIDKLLNNHTHLNMVKLLFDDVRYEDAKSSLIGNDKNIYTTPSFSY